MTDIESPEPAAVLTDGQQALPAPEFAPKPESRPQRTGVKALAAVVVAALVGVGIGEAVIKVHYDEDPAPVAAAPATPSASPSAPWGAKSNGNHFGSLRDLLLPLPAGYRLGPDYREFGNDTERGRADVQADQEKLVAGVPDKAKDAAKQFFAVQHHTGSAVRSMVASDNRTTVVLTLDQFNQQVVAETSDNLTKWFTDNDLFRNGPQVPGHPGAHCVLPPLEAGDQLDYLRCFSAEGDLLVYLEASAVAPLDQNKVVDLFRQQLDRLATPGATA